MPKSPIVPLKYDLARAVNPQAELTWDDLANLAPHLATAHSTTLERAIADPVHFAAQPDRLLDDYRTNRHRSDLGRILNLAKRLNAQVDRVVLLGNRPVQLAAWALFAGCCHPFHNELGRGERGGYPRLDFDGACFDNDTTQGLLDLLGRHRKAADVTQRWAIVVVGDSPETKAAFQHFLRALRTSCGQDESRLTQQCVAISSDEEILAQVPHAEILHASGIDQRYSIFAPAALLPAAIVGLDIVKLIRGAAAMNAHFRQAALDRNLVLQFAAIAHLMHTHSDRPTRIQAMWSQGLEATGRWYEQLHPGNAFRLGDQWQPFEPASSYITNFIAAGVRRDRLALDGVTVPERLLATTQHARKTAASLGCPSVDLHLPQLDEPALGHLLQLLMLSAAIESQLAANVAPT